MKYSYIIVLLLVSGCTATTMTYDPILDESLKQSQYILELPEMTKDDIYVKANQWAVSTFRDAESVIEFSDKEAGNIMGKYVDDPITEPCPALLCEKEIRRFRTTISIDVREGRARMSMTDPTVYDFESYNVLTGQVSMGWSPITKADDLRDIRATWEVVYSRFEEYMSTPRDDF